MAKIDQEMIFHDDLEWFQGQKHQHSFTFQKLKTQPKSETFTFDQQNLFFIFVLCLFMAMTGQEMMFSDREIIFSNDLAWLQGQQDHL